MKHSRITGAISIWITMIVTIYGSFFSTADAFALRQEESVRMNEWKIKWVQAEVDDKLPSATSEDWVQVNVDERFPDRPKGVYVAWLMVALPEIGNDRMGVLFGKLYGQNIDVYLADELVFHSEREYLYDENRVLIPVGQEDSGGVIYIRAETRNAFNERIGIGKAIQVGDYTELFAEYQNADLDSLIIGASLCLIAVMMLICHLFLDRKQTPVWLSLCAVMICAGSVILTLPPSVFLYYPDYGSLFAVWYDLGLLLSMPSLLYFVEQILGGIYPFIRTFRQAQLAYSLLCILFMIVNVSLDYRFDQAYFFVSVTLFGLLLIVQFVMLCIVAVRGALNREADAIILSFGFAWLALWMVADLVRFYASVWNELVLWKWGIAGFVMALTVMLGRRLSGYHRQIVNYSKEVELYNEQLQRSEKMEMISELAASIAHEVRNPLQVTKGFLQLYAEKSDEKGKKHMDLAIAELNRASEIISDYLTFAKPQSDITSTLDIRDEFNQIEGIIVPLVQLSGGRIDIEVPQGLYIEGNSSKLKQVIINLVKNSIEAFRENGEVKITAQREADEVVILLKDNGAGMDVSDLTRLGQPYFSTKSKGTGLGLMVSFRIVELMRGTIEYRSEKGVGTEAVLRFPSVKQMRSTL